MDTHDDAMRHVVTTDEAGVVVSVRPYSVEENAEADARAFNELSVTQALVLALTELQAIIDDTNANINSNPASRIKTMARVLRRLIRVSVRQFDATD